jgi:hypothetical protein
MRQQIAIQELHLLRIAYVNAHVVANRSGCLSPWRNNSRPATAFVGDRLTYRGEGFIPE